MKSKKSQKSGSEMAVKHVADMMGEGHAYLAGENLREGHRRLGADLDPRDSERNPRKPVEGFNEVEDKE